MQFHLKNVTGVLAAAMLAALSSQSLAAQQTQNKEVRGVREAKPLPPRATPGDYSAHAQAGTVTIAADFAGHGIPTPDGVFSNEDYIVVEVGLYGSPDARLRLSFRDFSLRINGKKALLPAQPYELAFHSMKDPEWVPPGDPQPKSSGSGLGTGGAQDAPPAAPKMPIPLVLAMEQKVKKASIQEGDRPLPDAGLLFFQFGGKLSGIRSVELVYNGAAGKAVLALQ